LDKVVEDILSRGQEKRQEIVRLGEQDRDEQIRQAEKRVGQSRDKMEKRTKAMLSQLEQQELSSGELESKKIILVSQRQVMEELKEEALSQLAKYPSESKKKIYSKMVSRAKKEFGDCVIYSRNEDRALLQIPSGMRFGDPIECRGGLIFESMDRSIRLDFRFETLLDDVWNAKLQEIYGKLFG